MTADFHTKFRPTTLKEILGQKELVKSLQSVLAKKICRAFLLHGPAGCGKTTTARIIASMVGCAADALCEVDAATYSGIDAMRSITETLNFKPIGSDTRVIIIDEAHSLSSSAWQSLLKSVEEPPLGVYWVFCTTNPSKVPETIKTRCACFQFSPVSTDDLVDLLIQVADAEGLPHSDEMLTLIARMSNGSPRKALTSLAKCCSCTTVDEIRTLLQVADEGDVDVIELCRYLSKGTATWEGAMKIVNKFKVRDAESLRIVIVSYMGKVVLGSKNPQQALSVIEAFSTPYPANANFAYFLLSLGTLLLAR